MEVSRVSEYSGKTHTMEMEVTPEQLLDLAFSDVDLSYKFIQNLLPHLTSDEREFIMTGITADEWFDMFDTSDEVYLDGDSGFNEYGNYGENNPPLPSMECDK